jgi:hypothetical protein
MWTEHHLEHVTIKHEKGTLIKLFTKFANEREALNWVITTKWCWTVKWILQLSVTTKYKHTVRAVSKDILIYVWSSTILMTNKLMSIVCISWVLSNCCSSLLTSAQQMTPSHKKTSHNSNEGPIIMYFHMKEHFHFVLAIKKPFSNSWCMYMFHHCIQVATVLWLKI